MNDYNDFDAHDGSYPRIGPYIWTRTGWKSDYPTIQEAQEAQEKREAAQRLYDAAKKSLEDL